MLYYSYTQPCLHPPYKLPKPMPGNYPLPLPVFDAETWQLYYEQTQEALLLALNDLSRSYLQLKQEYDRAPAPLKKNLLPRLKRLEKLIKDLNESYKLGYDYVGSLVTSLYVEFECMRQSKDDEIDCLLHAVDVVTEAATTRLQHNISLKNNT